MEGVQTISVSDLLRLSRPLTGAASLHRASPFPSPPPSKKPKLRSPPEAPPDPHLPLPSLDQSNANPQSFAPLHHPVLLIGTIDLPSDCLRFCLDSGNHYFSFSDGSATVCCAVLDLDVSILGRTIHVLAWNFLPFKTDCTGGGGGGGGGLLEIIRWTLPASSNNDSVISMHVQQEAHSIRRPQVCGVLQAVSPIFMVPHASPTDTTVSVGFLAKILACVCHICVSSLELHDRDWDCHSFAKPAFVYFLEHASQWRPALVKLIGKLIEVWGLKKKMVFVGGAESYLMFVTMENTAVTPCLMPVGRAISPEGGDGGVYNGVVTGIYMQGMVVELDEKVWLLVRDPMLPPQHSLRVGAIVSVRNIHLVRTKFSCMSILLLGTCVRTSIDIKSFSPSDSRCHFRTWSQSLLGKFIESLTLSARLWVLLLVSCFRRKFANTFSDKEILGSKNREGLAQIYARAALPPDVYQPQNGIFMDFCNRDHYAFRNESNLSPIKLVIPISNFIRKCETLWLSMILQIQRDAETVGGNDIAYRFSCEGRSYRHIIRKIISSEDLGLILMGTLKISPSSGRLQLVDATGSVDVVVPDLISHIDTRSIHEIKDYRIIIEGLPTQLNLLEEQFSEPISCRNFLRQFPCQKLFKQLAVYVHFYLRDSSILNISFPVHSCMGMGDDLMGNNDQLFHLLVLTHKFPAIMNTQNDPANSDESSAFAEAIVLPYSLILSEKHGDHQFAEVTQDKGKTQCEYVESQKSPEKLWSSWRKLVHASSRNPVLFPKTILRRVEKKHNQIPCMLTFSSDNFLRSPLPCYLCLADSRAVEDTVDGHLTQKILLEFVPDGFSKYQFLTPGACYILKCSKQGLLCNKKGCDYLNHRKVVVNSQTTLLSICFSFGEVAHQDEAPLIHSFSFSPVRVDESTSGNSSQNEILFQQSINQIYGTSDVRLHLCAEVIEPVEQEIEAVKNRFIRFIKFLRIPGEVVSVSSCIHIMRAEPVRPFEALHPQSSNLSEGKLISLTGNIENIHIYHCRSRSNLSSQYSADVNKTRVFKICIHVYDDFHMVRLRGSFSRYSYPLGMGPGANATFHRILMISWQDLALTPVSFVVINSVKEVAHQSCERRFWSPSRISNLNEDFFKVVSLSLLLNLEKCRERKLIRCQCRVITVHVLVLEKHGHDSGKSESRREFEPSVVRIPLAGFVLDDGSSMCCCWADGCKAEALLRLNETSVLAVGSSYKSWHGAGSNKLPYKNPQDNVGYHLDKMLKKHHRIIVKNHEVVPESSSLDLTFSVNSDEVFSNFQEKIVKFIILNACGGSNFDIVGDTMDLNGFEWLHTKLLGFQPVTQQMPNIWVREIQKVNPLKEARDVLHELLIR